MTFKTNLLLTAMLLALAGFVYLYEIRGGEEREKSEEQGKKLLGVEADSVTALTLQPAGIRLKKEAGKWRVVGPVEYAADLSSVESLLQRLESAQREREIAYEAEDFVLDGLAPEQRQIIVSHAGRSDTVFLGDKNPTSSFVYARVNSKPQVVLTEVALWSNSDKSLEDWRDKKLAAFESYRADYVSLQYPETTIVCAKDTASEWQVTAPQNKKAKSWKVSNITSTLAGLQAVAFIDAPQAGDLARYGLDNPRARIVVKEKGAELAQVLLGTVEGERVYAKAADKATITLVKKEEADRLLVKLSELIE